MGSAQAISLVFGGFVNFNNSGQIYAVSNAGAYAEVDGGGDSLTNSGLMAAKGDNANAIDRLNGGQVINTASGSILAEGASATAITLGRGLFPHPTGPDVDNAGLIEATSTDPSTPSVGIYAANLPQELLSIINSGTITADYAFYSDDYAFIPANGSVQTIQNTASGHINGALFFGMGDDLLVNKGVINGHVDMGEDDDKIDNSTGRLIGSADLGADDDTYIGGAFSDAVTGGRGNDVISGGGGDDLLLGGRGDDILKGEAGNDGLYGETGDDRITTEGGDHVEAGAGDDTVVLGDYLFARVDGGAGHDTLVLPAAAKVLDLQAVLASGRLAGFEAISLPARRRSSSDPRMSPPSAAAQP